MSLSGLCNVKIAELNAILMDREAGNLHARATELRKQFLHIKTANDISPEACTGLIDALHKCERTTYLYHAKASDAVIAATDAIVAEKEKNWGDLEPLAVDPTLRVKLAGMMMDGSFQHVKGGDYLPFDFEKPPLTKERIMFTLTPYGRGVGEHIMSYMLKYGVPFETEFMDPLFRKELIEASSTEQVTALAAHHGHKFDGFSKNIILNSRPPIEVAADTGRDPGKKKKKIFDDASVAFEKRRRGGEGFYTTTRIPTHQDAELDKIPYADYLKLFFELCDQPWKHIHAAQKHLIEKMNAARTVRIVDQDTGTNLTMSVEGKKWVNSLILKNVPGSEVYASPTKESVNGTLVAKGRFQYKESPIIEDIKLEFKDGEVVSYSASTPEGTKALGEIIEKDDKEGKGSRFLGEIGIGTNPWLKQHVINPLLVEKISGSVHLALGSAYTYNEYDGLPVAIDNKNSSKNEVHWDITTMMNNPRSQIIIDDGTESREVIMRAGRFTDPALNVFNDGWAAIPEAEQPEYWQARLKQPRTSWAASI